MLKTVATAIRKKVRERDKVYRVGGDEFAILSSDFSVAEARGMFERIANTLKNTPTLVMDGKGKEVKVTVTLSVGIAACSNPTDIEAAFGKADQAAIKGKEDGRDRITTSE